MSDDLKMLDACIRWARDHEDEASERWRDAFENMRSRLSVFGSLTAKQRVWVSGIYEKLFDEPTYENAWSAGKISAGSSLKTNVPEVLRRPLPMKPPGRR
jgi:hypothetical protein